jgi:hypothetical protein
LTFKEVIIAPKKSNFQQLLKMILVSYRGQTPLSVFHSVYPAWPGSVSACAFLDAVGASKGTAKFLKQLHSSFMHDCLPWRQDTLYHIRTGGTFADGWWVYQGECIQSAPAVTVLLSSV